jgi:hypothetical protein
MVTMVRDTSVYSLDSFKKQMKAAGESSVTLVFAFYLALRSLSCSSPLADIHNFSRLLIRVSQQICRALSTGKRIDLKGGKFPNCRDLQKFKGHGHFQSLFEMGTEEDAELLKEQRKKEDGEPEKDRKKGEKGWRYGAVSLRCCSCFYSAGIDEHELTRDIAFRSMP